MAKAIPNPEPPRNGGAFDPRGPLAREPVRQSSQNESSGLEPWNPDELLPKRGGDETGSLLKSLGIDRGEPGGAVDAEAVRQLQAENEQLKSIVLELEQELEASKGKGEQDWGQRQKEYEGLLDEKTELIRNLHLKMQELQQQQRPPTPKEDELIAMSEELERERCQLQQERRQLDEELRQLKEDSEIMTQEMRQMEVQMARERADLARQRMEIQRLNDEIRHELDRVEKDRGLSDRLVQLRQRHMDAVRGKSAIPPSPAAAAPPRQPSPQTPADGGETESKDNTGILRRFFR